LVIGVDIAQEAHVARAVSFRGIALGSPLEFGSHDEGFRLFGRWIQDLLKSYKLSKIIVGMEPTGHYWLSLARWLADKGIEAVLVNPGPLSINRTHRTEKITLLFGTFVQTGWA
jgi:transposase